MLFCCLCSSTENWEGWGGGKSLCPSLTHKSQNHEGPHLDVMEKSAHQPNDCMELKWCLLLQGVSGSRCGGKSDTGIWWPIGRALAETARCSPNLFPFPPAYTAKWHFPASFAARCGHLTNPGQWNVGRSNICRLQFSSTKASCEIFCPLFSTFCWMDGRSQGTPGSYRLKSAGHCLSLGPNGHGRPSSPIQACSLTRKWREQLNLAEERKKLGRFQAVDITEYLLKH